MILASFKCFESGRKLCITQEQKKVLLFCKRLFSSRCVICLAGLIEIIVLSSVP